MGSRIGQSFKRITRDGRREMCGSSRMTTRRLRNNQLLGTRDTDNRVRQLASLSGSSKVAARLVELSTAQKSSEGGVTQATTSGTVAKEAAAFGILQSAPDGKENKLEGIKKQPPCFINIWWD